MLTAIRKLLNAIGNVDEGTEVVLNHAAFQAICDLLQSVFGHSAVHKWEQACTRIDDQEPVRYVLNREDFGDDLFDDFADLKV